MQSIRTIEYYSVLKKGGEVLTHAATQMNPEVMMLGEMSQSQKDKYVAIPFISGTVSSQILRQKVEWWLPGAEVGRGIQSIRV